MCIVTVQISLGSQLSNLSVRYSQGMMKMSELACVFCRKTALSRACRHIPVILTWEVRTEG